MSLRFLIDESLPRSLERLLREAGLEAADVRAVGLAGRPDSAVHAHAKSNDLVLVTRDVGFGNILKYPLGTHPGIVLIRFPTEITAVALTVAVRDALRELTEREARGNLLVVEPGRVRVRTKEPPVWHDTLSTDFRARSSR